LRQCKRDAGWPRHKLAIEHRDREARQTREDATLSRSFRLMRFGEKGLN
jgi:hypothetical protein